MSIQDFSTDHLSGEALKVATAIREMISSDKGAEANGYGCTAFYTPEKWRERGESYGLDSVLILCHDGGDLAQYCNIDYGCPGGIERMRQCLEPLGYWIESCTCWYSAVYPVNH